MAAPLSSSLLSPLLELAPADDPSALVCVPSPGRFLPLSSSLLSPLSLSWRRRMTPQRWSVCRARGGLCPLSLSLWTDEARLFAGQTRLWTAPGGGEAVGWCGVHVMGMTRSGAGDRCGV